MAQGRLIDKKIIHSERVADLSPIGQVIYTWSIIVADDFGLLQGSPRTIKGLVLPMNDISLQDVEKIIDQMIESKLWSKFEYEDKSFYYIESFEKFQHLREDMQPNTILPVELKPGKNSADYKSNWDFVRSLLRDLLNDEKIVKVDESPENEETPVSGVVIEEFESKVTTSDEVAQLRTISALKGREEKGSKEKLIEKEINKEKDETSDDDDPFPFPDLDIDETAEAVSLSVEEENGVIKVSSNNYPNIEDLTEKDLDEIAQRYDVPIAFVLSIHEDMILWRDGKPGNKKLQGRNWKKTLMVWVKRESFKIRKDMKGDHTKAAVSGRNL